MTCKLRGAENVHFQSRSQGLSSLPPLVVGTETLVVAGHVTTQNLGGRKICWEPEKYQDFNGKI